eukprot:COSAG05_NODE_307_length_11680_cov_162.848804_1_plen_334_part_10
MAGEADMRVVFLKEADDSYAAALADRFRAGAVEAEFVPLTTATYDAPSAAAAVSAALLKMDTCGSVVFSSHRACTGLRQAISLLEPEAASRWHQVHRAFVVGPKTAAASELAFPGLAVEPPGGARDAEALCAYLQRSGAAGEVGVLRLRGGTCGGKTEGKVDSLTAALHALAAARVAAATDTAADAGPTRSSGVEAAVVYEMAPLPLPGVLSRLYQLLSDQGRCWVVCFSPAKLKDLAALDCASARPIFTTPPRSDSDSQHTGITGVVGSDASEGGSSRAPNAVARCHVRLLALGATTAAAMLSASLACDAVAQSPTPAGVAQAIFNAELKERP